MKKKLIKLIIFCLVDIISVDMAIGADNIRKVKAVDFRGLEILSKYELFGRTNAKQANGGLIVDVDSLNRALAEEPYVDSFSVSESGGILIVNVTERKPVMSLALVKGGRVMPFEVDRNFKPISVGRIHSAEEPLVILGEADVKAGVLSARVKNLFYALESLKKKNESLYREILEINVKDDNLELLLRGRRTVFKMKSNSGSFAKLNWTAGYLDRIKRYPEMIDLTGHAVVIR